MRKRQADSTRLEIDGKVLCIDADPANHAMVASVLAVAPGVELRIVDATGQPTPVNVRSFDHFR